MFKKKLTTNKFLFLITLCILVNILESWYFGFNMEAQSTAEYICDWINSIPMVLFTLWYMFTNDYIEFCKGMIAMMIISASYYIMYAVMLA